MIVTKTTKKKKRKSRKRHKSKKKNKKKNNNNTSTINEPTLHFALDTNDIPLPPSSAMQNKNNIFQPPQQQQIQQGQMQQLQGQQVQFGQMQQLQAQQMQQQQMQQQQQLQGQQLNNKQFVFQPGLKVNEQRRNRENDRLNYRRSDRENKLQQKRQQYNNNNMNNNYNNNNNNNNYNHQPMNNRFGARMNRPAFNDASGRKLNRNNNRNNNAHLRAQSHSSLNRSSNRINYNNNNNNPFNPFRNNKADDDDDDSDDSDDSSSSSDDDNNDIINDYNQNIKTAKRLQKLSELSSRQEKAKKSGKRKVIHKQKVNANVISIELGTLKESAKNINSGDPIKCQNDKCGSILSKYDGDKLLKQMDDIKLDDQDQSIWKCQFCGNINIIDIDDEEIPKGETIDYILEPPQEEEKNVNGNSQEDEKQIIFCIDISGSMVVTQPIDTKKAKLKLKGNRLQQEKDNLSQFIEANANHLNEESSIQYVSRLQCLQACVDEQIDTLSKTNPNKKVGLITFNSSVTVYGDAINENNDGFEIITGDKLNNLEKLKEIGISEKCKIKNNISKSNKKLNDAIWSLEESGQTALGPALTVAISQGSISRGSQVILCTDGLANIGVGKIDNESDENINKFYQNLGEWALSKGVCVSIISITGDGCKLENLGKIAELTGGNVRRINPLKLTDTFSNILQEEIIATHSNAKMLLHPGLLFVDTAQKLQNMNPFQQQDNNANNDKQEQTTTTNKDNKTTKSDKAENDDDDKDKKVKLYEVGKSLKEVGNVFSDTTIFFEYGVRKDKIKEFKHLKKLPFQVQILYKKIDGTKMLRVITQEMKTTFDKKQVRENLDFNVLSKYGTRISTKLCQIGDYEAARTNMNGMARYMHSNANNNRNQFQQHQQLMAAANYVNNNIHLDYQMHQQQQQEISINNNNNNNNNNINLHHHHHHHHPSRSRGRGGGRGRGRGGSGGARGGSVSNNSNNTWQWRSKSNNNSRRSQRNDKFSSIHYGMKRKF